MSETILRQWSILRSLPVYPRKRTARKIENRLEGDGFVVSKRNIERDLEKLSGLWPISADQSGRPYGWYWMEDAGVLDAEDLRWWLLGFDAGVEVMGPARLRKRMTRTVQAMAALYGS